MYYKSILISAAVVITCLVSVCGCSHRSFHHFGGGSSQKMAEMITDKISSDLDLTDSQKDKLNEIKDEIITKIKSRKNNFDQMFNFLQTEIKKDKIDENLLKQKFNEFHSDREEIHSFIISKMVEFHSILTKEQKEKLSEKMQEMKDKFHFNN